jgi:hypothetical protein
MLRQEDYSAMRDAEHLKLLSIFHYVMAGLEVVGACFASLYLVMAFFFANMPVATGSGGSGMSPADAQVLQMMTWIWALIGGVGAALGIAMAVCSFFAARFIAARRRPVFVMVVAGIECLAFPLGTALGVFTILVLQRPSVRAVFEGDGLPAGHSNA